MCVGGGGRPEVPDPHFSFPFKVTNFASVKDGCYLCATVCEIRTGSDTGIDIDCFPLFMAEIKARQ